MPPLMFQLSLIFCTKFSAGLQLPPDLLLWSKRRAGISWVPCPKRMWSSTYTAKLRWLDLLLRPVVRPANTSVRPWSVKPCVIEPWSSKWSLVYSVPTVTTCSAPSLNGMLASAAKRPVFRVLSVNCLGDWYWPSGPPIKPSTKCSFSVRSNWATTLVSPQLHTPSWVRALLMRLRRAVSSP